jgi:hypothetical protein
MFPAPVCGKPRAGRTPVAAHQTRRNSASVPTFPAPVHGKSRAAFLAAPRWAPVESFPPERFRPLLRLGKGNPLTVISSIAGDMFPAPVCGKSPRWTNARRGALNAPQLLPPVPTFPAPVHGKAARPFWPRPAGLRWNRSRRSEFRPLLRSGNGNPLTVISSIAGDMFPAPVCGKSLLRTNARRGALNAPQLCLRFRRFRSGPREKPRGLFGRAPRPVGRERYAIAPHSNVSRSSPREKPRGLFGRAPLPPRPRSAGLHLPARRSPIGFALSSRAHIKYSSSLAVKQRPVVGGLGAHGDRGHQAPAFGTILIQIKAGVHRSHLKPFLTLPTTSLSRLLAQPNSPQSTI